MGPRGDATAKSAARESPARSADERVRLSVLIPAFNERGTIEACIASCIDIADELVVADSFSTDGTPDIARSLGARVIQREYGYSASQKNWAMQHLAHRWVLIVDADERLTPALREEIRRVLARPDRLDGYWIRRRTFFLGKPLRCLSFDTVLRLFDRSRGQYEDKLVHAEVKLEGATGSLEEPMEHHTFRAYGQYEPKMIRYSTWAAQDAFIRGRRSSVWRLVSFPLGHFLKYYLVKGGFLDGTRGLMAAANDAVRTYLKYAKMMELEWRSEAGEGLELPAMDTRRPGGDGREADTR